MPDFAVEIKRSDGTASLEVVASGPRPGGCCEDERFCVAWVGDAGRPPDELGPALIEAWKTSRDDFLRGFEDPLAGALLDRRHRTVEVFRDRFGLVPVRVWTTNHAVQVRTDPFVPQSPRLNVERLVRSLARVWDGGLDDYFEGVERIRPGEAVTWRDGQLVRRRLYWNPETRLDDSKNFEQVANHLRDTLSDVVSRRVPGNHAAAFFVSGGLDASTLAAIASRRGVVRGFSMVSPGLPPDDESPWLDILESALPIDLRRWNSESFWPLREPEFYCEQRAGLGPLWHPNMSAEVAFSRWAAGHSGIELLITGLGADLLFHATPMLVARRQFELGRLLDAARTLRSTNLVLHAAVSTVLDRVPMGWRAKRWVRRRRSEPVPAWLRHTISTQRDDVGTKAWGRDRRERLLDWDWETVMRLNDLKARATGTRFVRPWLDRALWEEVLPLPPEFLIRDGLRKALLREIARGLLPEETRLAPKLGGADKLVEKGLAIHESEEVHDIFDPSMLHAAGIVNGEVFRKEFNSFVGIARRAFPNGPPVGSAQLWQAIAAEIWFKSLHGSGLAGLEHFSPA